MGNSTSHVEERIRENRYAEERYRRIKDFLDRYPEKIYRSEFGTELPDSNTPNLVDIKKYSNVSYHPDINKYEIAEMLKNTIEIPSELSNKSSEIIANVIRLAELVVAQDIGFAFSRVYTWRMVGTDGNEYLYTLVIAAASINTTKWGIPEGISCQTLIVIVFRVESHLLSLCAIDYSDSIYSLDYVSKKTIDYSENYSNSRYHLEDAPKKISLEGII